MLSENQAQAMLGEVTSLYEDAANHFRVKRSGLSRIVENSAYYRGMQQVLKGGVESTNIGERAQTVNIVRKIVTNAVAEKIRQIPEPKTPAARDDQKSRNRSRAIQRLCRSLIRNNIIDEDEVHRLASWCAQNGPGYLKMAWDPNSGRPLQTGPTGFEAMESASGDPTARDAPLDELSETPSHGALLEENMQDDGFGGSAPSQVFEGEIHCEFVPTIDGFPDPAARSRKEMRYFCHRKLRPVGELEQDYPLDVFGKKTKGKFSRGKHSMEQAAFRQMTEEGGEHLWSSNQKHESEENVLAELVEFWERPSRKFPSGRLIIFSGPLVLAMGPCPLMPARIPFIHFAGDNINPVGLGGDGTVEDVKQAQKNANFAETKLAEHLDVGVNFHILAPLGSGVTRNTWGNKSGQVIPYARGMQPTPWQPSPLPASVYEYSDKQIARAQEIAGYSNNAVNLPSNTSGRTFAFAEEASKQAREPDQISWRRSFFEVFQHALWLVKQFYDDGRKLVLVGENNEWELVDFNSDDYDLANDVVFEVYSQSPLSHSGTVDEVLSFANAHLFDDGPAPERARRMLGDEYAYKMSYDPFEAHRARARRENTAALRFQPIPVVKTYDNHKVHLEEHDKFRVSPEFENLPEWQQQLFETHCMLHEEIAVRQAALSISDQSGLQDQLAMRGPPMGQEQPGMPPEAAAQEGNALPAPPPTSEEFSQMSDSEQRATDQA